MVLALAVGRVCAQQAPAVVIPVEVSTTQPPYPREAIKQRHEGTVLLLVLVDVDGKPINIKVDGSSGYEELDRAAADAVTHWTFRPETVNGIAKRAVVRIPVNFSLNFLGGDGPAIAQSVGKSPDGLAAHPQENVPQPAGSTQRPLELVSVHVNELHFWIPRSYVSGALFPNESSIRLVLRMHESDLKPLTDEEQAEADKSRVNPHGTIVAIVDGTAKLTNYHVQDNESRFKSSIRDPSSLGKSYRPLSPHDDVNPNYSVFHTHFAIGDVDIYLLKNSSPKFYFECFAPQKREQDSRCMYYERLADDVELQVWSRKSSLYEIPELAPKVGALITSFVANDPVK